MLSNHARKLISSLIKRPLQVISAAPSSEPASKPDRPLLLAASLFVYALSPSPAFADGALLQYDPAGNITQRTGPSGTTTYGYDAVNRLNSEAGPAKTQSVTYDANGNRLTDGAGNITYSPSSNRIATRLGANVSYDAAGHMTSDGSGKTYGYNQAGQLNQVWQGSTLLASYGYDYAGQRVLKVTTAAAPQGAQTVLYHYDQFGKLSAETREDGTPLRTYVWRDDAPLAQIEYSPSRRIIYYEADHLDTPRAASDESGKVIWRWESDAFGSTPPNEDPDGDGIKTTINLRFPGQYFDKETGLHYNYARSYDPKVGRYTTSDPIGLAGGVNTYSYVSNNPLKYVDPLGLEKLILLPSNDPNYPAAVAAPDLPGQLTIYAHGNPNKVAGKDANELALFIQKRTLWKPNMPIKLDACRTGVGENNIARDLSEILGATVTAPNSRTLAFGKWDFGAWHSINIPGTDRTIAYWPGTWITYPSPSR